MNDYISNGLHKDSDDWRSVLSFGIFVTGLCVLVLVAMIETVFND